VKVAAWVAWWCNLIGVTDPTSIAVAAGIIAAAIVCFAAYLVLGVLLALLARR
jgi:hypothetical protein